MTHILQRRRHIGARMTIEVNESRNNLQGILGALGATLQEIDTEQGGGYDPQRYNLTELLRRMGLTRSRAD